MLNGLLHFTFYRYLPFLAMSITKSHSSYLPQCVNLSRCELSLKAIAANWIKLGGEMTMVAMRTPEVTFLANDVAVTRCEMEMVTHEGKNIYAK